MRIASLVPSATEMLFALGLGDDVVAVTHECDWPAEEMGHHPDLSISWDEVAVSITTHAKGGLTDNDFELAARIDALAS